MSGVTTHGRKPARSPLASIFLALFLGSMPMSAARAMDLDLHLIGYSFLSVTSAQRTPSGLELTLRDGSHRTVDLTYGYLLGFAGQLDRPTILHQHWLRMTFSGGRANLVCTSTPLLVAALIGLVVDALLLAKILRRLSVRRRMDLLEQQESDRGGLSPTPTTRQSGDNGPPTP